MSKEDKIQRSILPIPDTKHVGLTTYDAKDPETKFPPIRDIRPPEGAPNVLVILLDDVGFGASSAFGGPVNTPAAERLADNGLKLNRFHTTALCSPTRQALLTGRNHHSVNMGGITEMATSAPGYTSVLPKDKAPLAGKFDQFLLRLSSRMNDKRYDFMLKPKLRTSSESLIDLLRDFVGLGEPKCQITVIDLSTVPFDVRPTVAAQVGRLAFEFNYWNPYYQDFPLLLVCEEAHAYIPRDNDPRYEGARRSMQRIAKEGRKYGVGITVVSQRPHELSETVLAQCSTYLCLRLTNPDDQAYVKDLVPEAERDLTDVLASLGRGEVLAMGAAVPLPTRLQFYKPNPVPNSSDVDFYQHWIAGPDDLDVDDIVDRWRRQDRIKSFG